MHEHASKMELGDKETVAICIQASVTCYLHVIHRYIRVWYVPYAYGHTVYILIRVYGIQNCTIRVLYVPYAYGIKYAYGTEQLHGIVKLQRMFLLDSYKNISMSFSSLFVNAI